MPGPPPLCCPAHSSEAPEEAGQDGREPEAGRWLGDLKTCFLLDLGWALRFEITRSQLKGRGGWRMPLAFAAAAGLEDGERRVFTPVGESRRDPILLSREGGACVGGSIDEVLRAIGAEEGDVAFLAVRARTYSLTLRRQSELSDADPLSRLLWSCGLDPADDLTRAAPWPRLTRAVGASGSSREDLRRAVLRRKDEVMLGLIEDLERRVGRAAPRPRPGLWACRMAMTHERDALTVLGADGSARTALGVVDTSGQPPRGLIVSEGGLVWLHRAVIGESDEVSAVIRDAPRGLVPAAHKPAWVRWLRAEHGARRAGLLGTAWELRPSGETWWVGAVEHEDLVDALEAVALETEEVPPEAERPPSVPYPRSAVAFGRAVDEARRGGLESLSGHRLHGFAALYVRGREVTGASLMDVLV